MKSGALYWIIVSFWMIFFTLWSKEYIFKEKETRKIYYRISALSLFILFLLFLVLNYMGSIVTKETLSTLSKLYILTGLDSLIVIVTVIWMVEFKGSLFAGAPFFYLLHKIEGVKGNKKWDFSRLSCRFSDLTVIKRSRRFILWMTIIYVMFTLLRMVML